MAGGVRNYFETNPYAQNVGQAVTGAVGLVGMYSNISNTVQSARETEYDIPIMKNNPYEKPTYSLGQAWNQNQNFDPNEAGDGLVGQSAVSGVGAGASIGSMFGPWGTAIGAAAGGIVGGISGLFGKKKAEDAAAEAKRRELRELKAAQGEFNVQNTNYDSNMDARERYNKRLTDRRRKIQRTIG